jgi:hypothetical protein
MTGAPAGKHSGPMDDNETIDVIRDALEHTEGVLADRIVVDLRDDGVELLGAVATPEEATLAETVAGRHVEVVHNRLTVDRNLREDPTGPQVAPGARTERRARNEELSVQTSGFQPERVAEDLTDDVDRALAENIPWDPPDAPHPAPTGSEQRGVLDRDADVETPALAGDVPDDDAPSLAEMSQAELERSAAARPDEEGEHGR